jgi:uncharacterized protein YdeI (YjbR/CyaY-like superfamily)
MIKKQLNKNTTITIHENNEAIITTTILNNDIHKWWTTGFRANRKALYHYTNVCEHCDDMNDVKYMNEAEACLCFNCRESVGLEIMADEQWEDTQRSLMGVI